jgi:hypothetical protein
MSTSHQPVFHLPQIVRLFQTCGSPLLSSDALKLPLDALKRRLLF